MNFIAGTAATVHLLVEARSRQLGELWLRLASALVVGPLVLLLVYLGRPWFDLLVLLSIGIAGFEWARLCTPGEIAAAGWIAVVGCLGGTLLAVFGYYAAGLVVSAAVAVLLAGRWFQHPSPTWLAVGGIYLAVPAVALIWLRYEPAAGRDMVIWLFLVVWAADSGAYAIGRSVGGPRLAPAISPGKTWSGVIGGLGAATLAAVVVAGLFGIERLAWAGLVGFVLAVATSAGDLVESSAKRHFAVKDTGRLIPGHGGLLDRIDGLLVAAVTVCALWIAGWRWV